MNDDEILTRFEELEAGRVLGDLDAEELKEWQELSKNPLCARDLSLELTAAAVETGFLQEQTIQAPEMLLARVREGTQSFMSPEKSPANIAKAAAWKRLFLMPQTAWSVAALFALLFVAKSINSGPEIVPTPVVFEASVSPEAARDALSENADDLIETAFGGTESYPQMSGKVVWSDSQQEGYMTLTNLPVNDPKSKQYQLWIVDPTRDEKPVDGGVFDIPSGKETVVIPINNPVSVSSPKAFVITLEQPGGVVVSKQETVVALAKAS